MKFTFQELASAGTGYLWPTGIEGDNGIGGAYKVLNHMTGDNLFTHQLPRAFRACEAAIAEQHSFIKSMKFTLDELSSENRIAYMQKMAADWIALNGDEYELIPLTEFEHKDPLQELSEMVPSDRIIIAET